VEEVVIRHRSFESKIEGRVQEHDQDHFEETDDFDGMDHREDLVQVDYRRNVSLPMTYPSSCPK
jgi:hypothetical protein